MSRVCEICGKKVHKGNQLVYRGLPKYQGGIGLKITGKTRRTFQPNLQKVRAVVDGKVGRLRLCAKCLRSGHVTKPLKRRWKKPAPPAAPATVPAATAPTGTPS